VLKYKFCPFPTKKYLQIIISLMAFKPQKNVGAILKRNPNPELLNPDFETGFGIYKSRGIGTGIPLGTPCV
jgi:hypothetical protein